MQQFAFIKDANKFGNVQTLVDRLNSKISNSYVDAIPVDEKVLKEADNALEISNLSDVLNSLDLSGYEETIPLKTSRGYFISNFKNNIKSLSKDEQMQVFKHYNFYIQHQLFEFQLHPQIDLTLIYHYLMCYN